MDCYQQVWWGLQTNCKILSMTVWPQFFWHAAEWLWVVGTSCHRGTVWRWNQWLKVGAKMSIVPLNRRCFGGFRKIQNKKKCRKKQRSVVLWIVLDVLRITRIKTHPQCRCPEMEWRIWGKVGGTCEVLRHVFAIFQVMAMSSKLCLLWCHQRRVCKAPYQLGWAWLIILTLHKGCGSNLGWICEFVGPQIIFTQWTMQTVLIHGRMLWTVLKCTVFAGCVRCSLNHQIFVFTNFHRMKPGRLKPNKIDEFLLGFQDYAMSPQKSRMLPSWKWRSVFGRVFGADWNWFQNVDGICWDVASKQSIPFNQQMTVVPWLENHQERAILLPQLQELMGTIELRLAEKSLMSTGARHWRRVR